MTASVVEHLLGQRTAVYDQIAELVAARHYLSDRQEGVATDLQQAREWAAELTEAIRLIEAAPSQDGGEGGTRPQSTGRGPLRRP